MRPLFREEPTPIRKHFKWRNGAGLGRKGSLTVEAAIFLPLFIVGVLTFAYLIKFMAVQEAVFHAFTDEARVLAAEAGINPLNALLYERKVKDRIFDESGDMVSAVELEQFLYLYPYEGQLSMISMDLNYDVKIKLPIRFYKDLPVSESLLFRGFVGKWEEGELLPFEEMEEAKESQLVWIFPRAGEKYHGEDCITITSQPRQLIMTSQIRKGYDPCGICHSRGLADGALVYCFRTGKSYHTGKCPIVDKYVISVEKDEAVKNGYQPCLKCGGD